MITPIFEIDLPLSVHVLSGKTLKIFKINLNQYRNTHYIILNKAKKEFYNRIKYSLTKTPKIQYPIEIQYTYSHKGQRRIDLANICSVADKFFSDVLVELSIIQDDDLNTIQKVIFQKGKPNTKTPSLKAQIFPI